MDKKEYIDRSELIKVIGTDTAPFTISMVFRHIRNAPAADVMEVVRCKDCIWRGREECAMFYRCDCGEQHTWETDNDFCSYGERRD